MKLGTSSSLREQRSACCSMAVAPPQLQICCISKHLGRLTSWLTCLSSSSVVAQAANRTKCLLSRASGLICTSVCELCCRAPPSVLLDLELQHFNSSLCLAGRESRYFTTWKRPRQVVDFRLPIEIQELTGEACIWTRTANICFGVTSTSMLCPFCSRADHQYRSAHSSGHALMACPDRQHTHCRMSAEAAATCIICAAMG